VLESVRALLGNVIDYAGLFPPAALSMPEAVENFSRDRVSEDSWMLGRFIVPVTRLPELETALVSKPPVAPWKVSVLAGADITAAVSAVLAFNAHVRGATIDCMEAKAGALTPIREYAGAIPDGFTTYFEIRPDPDPAPLIEAIARANARAKIRTGGVKPEMFPAVEEVARFIRRCDEAKVPFKATAGLHHPLRGEYPLTYEQDSASCVMHGFLNLFLAAAFLWDGVSGDETKDLLLAQAADFCFARRGIAWREHWISTEQIRSARERLATAFGSCSFKEPRAELTRLGLP
jgi:hypothetical protein